MNDIARTREDELANLKAVTSSLRSGASKLILKFAKGDWGGGQDNEAFKSGTRLAANIPQAKYGLNRWADGKVADQRLVLMASGQAPPPRNEMGHTDPELWDCDDRGHPIDPVRLTFELPCREIAGLQREMIIAGGSRGFEAAIHDLLDSYLAVVDQVSPAWVPVIALEVGSYPHRQYGKVLTPALPLVGWLDPETGKVVASKQPDNGPINGRAPGKVKVKVPAAQVELDSDIPF